MIKGKDTEIADNIVEVAVDRDIAIIDEFGKNYTPEQKQNFFRSYNEMKEKVSPTKFATYYDMAYQYGLQNLGVQSAMKNPIIKNVLSTDALGRAYSAGYLEFKENLKYRASNIRQSNNKGSVKFDNVHKEMLNDTQKAVVGVAEILADVTGVNYEFFESQKDENGKYKGENGSYNRSTNTIRIDVNAGMKNVREGNNIMVVTLAHELTHYIEELSPQHYATLQEFAFNKLAEVKGQDINELIYLEENRIKRNREQNNMKPLNKSELTETAKSELVARSFEGMLTDKESIKELAKKDTGLFNKIKEKVLDFVKKIEKACSEILGADGKYKKGTVSEETRALQKYAKEMREMWNEALKDAGENIKSIGENTKGESLFSIRQFEDGKQFVEVDTDQDIFDNAKESDYPKIAQKVIKEKFQGKVVGTTNKAFVNGRSAKEYGYPPKRIKNNTVKKAKMRASTELDNLIEIGKFLRNEPDGRDGHTHKNNVGGFDYYNVTFKVGNHYFEGEINIEITNNGRLFRDITKIEDITGSMVSSYGNNPKSYSTRTSSNNSIAQNSENDNNILNQNRNTNGDELTAQQQKYFKGSKVRDSKGRLMIMYHGTPTGGFTIFKNDLQFFTNNKEYASFYEDPSASSRKSGKQAVNPQTYEVYLNIEKPFDIRDEKTKKLFVNEYVKGGWALGINPYVEYEDTTNTGLPSWEEADNIYEFLEENDMLDQYDGIIVDEGGYEGENGVVSRGIAYVTFKPEQIKNVNNEKPTEDADIRYQDRNKELTNREILATALKTTAVNNIERNKITEYQKNIEQLNELDKEYDIVNGALKELYFSAGKKQIDTIKELQKQADRLIRRINGCYEKLL